MRQLLRSVIRVSIPGGLALAGDQALKLWCDGSLQHLKRYPFWGQDWLVLTRYHNLGLIFGKYSGEPPGYLERYTTYAPSALWLLMIGAATLRFREAKRLERAAWVMLVLASFSNLLDQWRLRVVIDTFQLYVGGPEYMPFNLADVGIVCGLALVLVSLVREAGRALVEPKAPARQGLAS